MSNPEKMKFETPDLTTESVAKIEELFPGAVTEGKINFDMLRALLGEDVAGDEAYEFTWVGKREAIREAGRPIRKTLRPCVEESKDWDVTENLYIEGDNLNVLKLLQESYLGKVKMIYIDPPYNTGNDFVYYDNFAVSAADYDEETGAYDEYGDRLFRNTGRNGRFHSDWCSMIYPRLVLARNLLGEDGVMFISIDDNEVAQLRKICDEVFGEGNFVVPIIWKKRSTPPNDQVIGAQHEYILIYAKNLLSAQLNLRARTDEQIQRYKNPDKHPKGPWTPGDLGANIKGGRYVASLNYPIVNPNTGEEHYPPQNGNWRFNKEKMEQLLNDGELYFGEDGKGRPKLKRFLSEVKEGITYTSLWDFVPLNTQGSKEMTELLGNIAVFDNPKPMGLIKECLLLGSASNSIILDFFSGSATTAHAVMQLNAEDGGGGGGGRNLNIVQKPNLCGGGAGGAKGGDTKI
ncbi:MAG: site-specific DNA-methyltransferase [Coriobacteriales bacterium]|jgi:adenine-specific DNA-methyltransferase|nr:site-specific DNA-methyltransferase [Coriobacteriales bacterium]